VRKSQKSNLHYDNSFHSWSASYYKRPSTPFSLFLFSFFGLFLLDVFIQTLPDRPAFIVSWISIALVLFGRRVPLPNSAVLVVFHIVLGTCISRRMLKGWYKRDKILFPKDLSFLGLQQINYQMRNPNSNGLHLFYFLLQP
jgi:hypothetical protein